MLVTSSDIASIDALLNWWGSAEYFATAFVILGCVGEFVAEFTKFRTEDWRHKLGKISLLLLIAALGIELGALVRTNSLSGQEIAILNGVAADARTVAANAEGATKNVGIELAKQQERAANAEKTLLALQERIKPRRLTAQQSADSVKALGVLPNGLINFGYTSGGADEAFNFARQLLPLFETAEWSVRNKLSIANHLDIQVTGVGVLSRGTPLPNPNLPPSPSNLPPSGMMGLTPTLEAIQSAFRAVGIQVQFINFPVDVPEVVIGSKP
jgi:hypothetical protein